MNLLAPAHTPINSLPPEILISMLHEVTQQPFELMQLALVCRSWRGIVLGTSELWNRITVDKKTNEIQLRKQLDLSGETLLKIFLEWSALAALSQLVFELISQAPMRYRISSLSADIPYGRSEINDLVGLSLSGGHIWPHLKMLALYSESMRFHVHIRAPNLETFEIYRGNLREWDYVGLGFSVRDLQWETRGPDADVAMFLRAAARCPNLWRLKLRAKRASLMLPELQMDKALWSKVADLILECDGADLADILIILSPRLTKLGLNFRTLVQSVSYAPPTSRSPRCLRRLMVSFDAEPDDEGRHLLGQTLLQSVLDRYDPSDLESISFFPMCYFTVWHPGAVPTVAKGLPERRRCFSRLHRKPQSMPIGPTLHIRLQGGRHCSLSG